MGKEPIGDGEMFVTQLSTELKILLLEESFVCQACENTNLETGSIAVLSKFAPSQ